MFIAFPITVLVFLLIIVLELIPSSKAHVGEVATIQPIQATMRPEQVGAPASVTVTTSTSHPISLVTATPTPTQVDLPQWSSVISDSFDDEGNNTNKWYPYEPYSDEYGTYTNTITGDFFAFLVRPKAPTISWSCAEKQVQPATDFIVTVSAQEIEGSSDTAYGLLFHYHDTIQPNGDHYYQFYMFKIRNDQHFAFTITNEGRTDPLINWQQSSAIHTSGYNYLKVIEKDSDFTFYINDSEVGHFTSSVLDAGQFCLATQIYTVQPANLAFKNFSLAIPSQ